MPDRFLGFIILLRITTANTKSYKIKTTMNQHVGAVCPDFFLEPGTDLRDRVAIEIELFWLYKMCIVRLIFVHLILGIASFSVYIYMFIFKV